LSLSACSPSPPAQSPAQSDKPQTPQQSSPAAAGARQQGQRDVAPNPSTTPAGEPASTAERQAISPPATGGVVTAEKSPAPEPVRAEKPEPAKPQFREVTVPAGTALSVMLDTSLASDSSQVEDEVRGHLTNAIVINGVTAVPEGTEVSGTVREAKKSGRVRGRAAVAFQFERLHVRGESVAIRTATVSHEAAADRRDDVKKGAIGGAAGAIVGGIVGGGSGAAIGAGVGGAGAVVATRGDEVQLDAGTMVRTTLREPLKIVVRLR
jgi:hypothetical protein